MAKISAIVPVYNAETYIRELIESLQNQTLRDLEIILVDDGSPDNSGKICDEYAAADDRIRVIHKANAGVGAARNDGLDAASGDWLYFCDSDDYLEQNALETLVTTGEQEKADVVFGDINMIRGDKVELMHFHRQAFVTDDRRTLDQLVMTVFGRAYCYMPPESGPAGSCYGGPWNKIVRRALLERENFRFDLTVKGICDDLLYSIHLFAAADKVAYVPVVIYNYRLLEQSITHTYKGNLLQINDAIFAAWEIFMKRYGRADQYRGSYQVFVIRRLKATLGLYFFSEKNPKSQAEQYQELNALLDTEPYRTAIMEAEPKKLQNSYDKLIWQAAKNHSPRQLYLVYKLSVLIKRIKH